eukprot:COSAG05_NODE_382_length_10509_cov_8.360519_8_plen_432_part_00
MAGTRADELKRMGDTVPAFEGPGVNAYSRHSRHPLWSPQTPPGRARQEYVGVDPASQVAARLSSRLQPLPPPVQWHALNHPSRNVVYRRYGVLPWSARPSGEEQARSSPATPKGQELGGRIWDVDEPITKVGEATLARNEDPSVPGGTTWAGGRPEEDLLAAHQMITDEVEKMNQAEWAAHERAQEAAAFAPNYYDAMLTCAINRTVHGSPAEVTSTPPNSAPPPDLSFGSPRYRNQLMRRLDDAQRYGRLLSRKQSSHAQVVAAARAELLPTPPATPPEKPQISPLKAAFLDSLPKIFGLFECVQPEQEQNLNAQESAKHVSRAAPAAGPTHRPFSGKRMFAALLEAKASNGSGAEQQTVSSGSTVTAKTPVAQPPSPAAVKVTGRCEVNLLQLSARVCAFEFENSAKIGNSIAMVADELKERLLWEDHR